MSSGSFDRNAKTRRRCNARHNPKRYLRAFKQRPLLDVQLHESLVITFRQFHILKIPVESRFSANFVHRLAIAILQAPGGFRGKRSRKQSAPQAADAEARWFLRCKHQKLNRGLCPKSPPLQPPTPSNSSTHSTIPASCTTPQH